MIESMKMELAITAPHAGTVEGLDLRRAGRHASRCASRCVAVTRVSDFATGISS